MRLAFELRPDPPFIDVRLPELNGPDVARSVDSSAEIVFTKAYDRFAIAAFEIGAIDYRVKPFGRERFAATLHRVKTRLGIPPTQPRSARKVRSRPAL